MQTLKDYLKTRTQQEFADTLGVSRQMVSHWVKGTNRITAERAIQIEAATEGKILASDLRPDLWSTIPF